MNTKYPKVYSTLAILWFGHFLVDVMIGIWPVYKTMVHLDLAKAGLISAVCAFIGEGLQIFFGPMSDKGFRAVLILGGILAAAATSLMAYTQDYFLLFLIFLMTCVGSGAFHPSAVGLLGAIAENRKGLYITLFASGGALGMAFSQLIFTEVHHLFGGHSAVLGIPAVCLVVFVMFYGIYAEKNASGRGKSKSHDFRAFGKLFKHRELLLLYISQVCNQTIAWGTVFLLPDVLSSRGYDEWVAFGGGHLFFVLGGALMMVPGGYLSDKFSFRSVIVGASAIGMLVYYGFLFIPELSLTASLLLLFVMGAMIGVVNPVHVAFGNSLMPKDTGMVSAFLMGLAWCVSEGLGQGGGGLLTKCFTNDAPAYALAVLGICFVIGIMAAIRLPKVVKDEHRLEFAV